MKRLLQKWYAISIRTKIFLLISVILLTVWSLVLMVMFHLRAFSRESDVIMNDYREITGFMDTFSAENLSLENYIRPSAQNAREEYRAAIQKTDQYLQRLQPDIRQNLREEYVLKRAIRNAMLYYRASQQILFSLEDQDAVIAQYLSLKTQSAYIDNYSRDLLHSRTVQGGEQWQEIVSANTRSNRQFVGLMAVSTFLVFLALLVFTRSILVPLTDLSQAADRISARQYDAPPLEVRGPDELGRTAYSFNLMQTEIRRTIHALEKQAEMEKHLLEKEVEAAQMQRRLQEGRFAQLQSQINPHFLFNTLSTIAALAREEGAPLSEDLILRLSRFFRYSLESDEKLVPLGREMRLLQDYIELQEGRYGDRICFEVVSDPSLEELPVPKFILQPLVENAILHGLRECAGGGRVQVRSRQGRRGITVTCTDNGCGFDTKRPRAPGDHRSVGLDNIAERMELSGGRLDIRSIPGVGTCARITLKEGPVHDQNSDRRG